MNEKQIKFINKINRIFKQAQSVETALLQSRFIITDKFSNSDNLSISIIFKKKSFESKNFNKTDFFVKNSFKTIDNETGLLYIYSNSSEILKKNKIEIDYFIEWFSTKFIKLLNDKIQLKTNINNNSNNNMNTKSRSETEQTKKNLTDFYYENNYERDILHDLMPFKVKEILLIANLYDSYNIESEGDFSKKILGEYSSYNLIYAPRITAVTTYKEAQEEFRKKHFDLVVIIVGMDKKKPEKIAEKIKQDYKYLPIYLLLNNNTIISSFEKVKNRSQNIDNIFVWNGDSRIFFAMIKLLEDRVNLENDARKGNARLILLVEDSAKYYSRYLPLLYSGVMQQTKRIIENVTAKDELFKILSLRLRPKILLVSNFQEAKEIFDIYKNNFLSLITDVEFPDNNKLNSEAGFKLAKYIKRKSPIKDIPVIIQSSEISNREKAFSINCSFVDKNSDSLAADIIHLINYNMGFGDFVYYDDKGNKLDYFAKNIDDFAKNLQVIPDESLLFHAIRNHFSLWLMARGEFKIAEILEPLQADDFKNDIDKIRNFLIENIKLSKIEKNRGRIIDFSESDLLNENNITSLASGAFGGKGRGIAFIHSLIYKYNIKNEFTDINIKVPNTFIIGTDEYDLFIENTNIKIAIRKQLSDRELKKQFTKQKLSDDLVSKISNILEKIKNPIAVRSSGLFEDSLMLPFSGIFETYILPNNHHNIKIRVEQVLRAIKLVYASVFSQKARNYLAAINYKIEQERMAIVIQEVVGNKYDNYYYPHISGVAQSYNYYPYSHIKPEDGYANIALGLGTYVVEGEKAYRFCPKFPNIQNTTIKDTYLNSQLNFFAVNLQNNKLMLLKGENAGLIKLDISESEKHGTLKHLASVYDNESETLSPGIEKYGARVLNFANILQLDYIPLAKTLKELLKIGQKAIGSPVEIEFAIDLNKDENYNASFYLLQIKPLISNTKNYDIKKEDIIQDKLILYTDKAMGNGIISDIQDIIFVCKDNFDKSKTELIGKQVAEYNKKMLKENKKYILIGPGRWGTRDRWIGIPLSWADISNAKIIVETSLEGYPHEASSGSHFFHNVIAMNVGYFSVQHFNKEHTLTWEKLKDGKIINQTKYIKHIKFDKPLTVKMDGKKRIAIISE